MLPGGLGSLRALGSQALVRDPSASHLHPVGPLSKQCERCGLPTFFAVSTCTRRLTPIHAASPGLYVGACSFLILDCTDEPEMHTAQRSLSLTDSNVTVSLGMLSALTAPTALTALLKECHKSHRKGTHSNNEGHANVFTKSPSKAPQHGRAPVADHMGCQTLSRKCLTGRDLSGAWNLIRLTFL